MKTSNIQQGRAHHEAIIRGWVSSRRAGSRGITFRGGTTEAENVHDLTVLGGTVTDAGNGSAVLEVAESPLKAITPAQLTANTDNWDPVDATTGESWTLASIIRASTDASRNLTGFSVGSNAQRLVIENVGANPLVLKHDVTSTTANRFYLPGSVDLTLHSNAGVEIAYDDISDRWRVIQKLVVETDLSLSDVTTANVSSTKHGFAPKNSGSTTKFLRDDGTYAIPPGVGAGDSFWDSIVTKASDQSVTNSSTLVNDNDLSWSIGATNETWRFEISILYTTDATGDYKCDLALSTGTIGIIAYRWFGTDTTANAVNVSTGVRETAVANTTDITAGGGATNIVRTLLIDGFLFASGPATVTYRFAQNTTTAGQSAITKAGSRLAVRKLA